MDNVCLFIPFRKDTHSIHTINFVFETLPQIYEKLKTESVYKCCLVCSGEGFLHTAGKSTPLRKGDLFFTFPAESFAVESGQDFTYSYISFVGIRGNMIMEGLGINNRNFVFRDAEELCEHWGHGLSFSSETADLISESVLLYTFAYLGNRILPKRDRPRRSKSIDVIKKYLDDNFSDPTLSLKKMSKALSYNKKYISHVFKNSFGIGIIDYLNTVRIQNACTMIEQGYTGVNDIADRCGYTDPGYFSKIFKTKMGISPTQYMKIVRDEA